MRDRSAWRMLGIVLLAFGAAAIGGLCFAQEGGQADQGAAQGQQQAQQKQGDQQKQQEAQAQPSSGVVEQVMVTAEKRPEDVQQVPEALSVLNAENLGILFTSGPDVRTLSARVPSLMIESSFGRAFPRFYIRGLGNTDFDLNASQPVSMVVDEVVLENPIVKGMPLWDLDRVEVLRGPQGTLFGRNTDAGVVKFDSKKPSQTFDSSFNVSYGTFNNVNADGGVGGAISDTLSARLSVLWQSQSDWVDNGYTHRQDALGGYETGAARLQFLWKPNDDFSALLNVHGWHVDGTARIFRANIIEPGTNDFVPGFEQDKVYQDGKNTQLISSWGGMLRLEDNLGFANLTSVTGYERINNMYSRGDIDGGFGDASDPPYGPGFIPFTSETADGEPFLGQATEELRLASKNPGPFQWLVGAYYFYENVDIDSFSYDSFSAGNPQNGYATQNQKTHSYALFGSVDYALSDRWALKAGLRYSNDKKDFVAERPQPVFQPPLVAPITEHTSADNVSGDVSITYKANPNLNVYGRVATGYRGPSIQGRILFANDFSGGTDPATNGVSVAKAETITSGEVGIKSILFDQRLRLNLAGYVYQMDNQQLTAVGGKYNVATLLNAHRTDGHGLEADIEYIASANVFANVGLSYNYTKIDDPNLTVTPCAGGCTVLDPPGPNGTVYVNGNSLPYAPEWIFDGSLNFQSSPVNKGYFGTIDWAYSSNKSFFLYRSKEFNSDDLEFGLRLGYAWNADKYEVALWSRNLFNKKILEGGIDFDNLTGMTNEPRKIGLEFVAKL